MRDAAGSARPPATRCKNSRRGSFMASASPATLSYPNSLSSRRGPDFRMWPRALILDCPLNGRYRGGCVAKLLLRRLTNDDCVGLRRHRRERLMMGRREGGQGQFFYSFKLDEVVPAAHLVRQIDGVLDLGWVHKELAPYYSHTGRPSIDPVLMIRMLIVGYVFAIRSERRLCAEVQVNLAYRWFCKLGIEDKIPDHSVFCRARRERFRESAALRRVFEGVVAICIEAGVVGGEAFSVDASLIKADVDKKKRVPGEQLIAWPKTEEASRAVREYLAALDGARGDEASGGGDGGGSGG